MIVIKPEGAELEDIQRDAFALAVAVSRGDVQAFNTILDNTSDGRILTLVLAQMAVVAFAEIGMDIEDLQALFLNALAGGGVS